MKVRMSCSLRSPASAVLVSAVAFFAVLAAPSRAGAQPGVAPPPPPPPAYGGGYGRGYYYVPPPRDPTRRGFTLGVGVGLGGMSSDSNLTKCVNCNYDPIAFAFDFHLGGMINPRLALLGELFINGQTIDAAGFNWLSQTLVVAALQFWITDEFWVKGGLGSANLTSHYDDGFYVADDTIDSGLGLLAAAGYEVLHSPWFSIDLQGLLASGNYNGIDEHVNTATIGVGFTWY